ncbi:MAG: hypothetical protein HYS41_01100 [Candidatus Omnitrophica bacterium]|nr:hypothetical protein [Candidatus Omnitrophota bacterium]
MRKTLGEMRQSLENQNELIQKQQARIDELERQIKQPAATPAAPSGPMPAPPAPAKGSSLPGVIGSVLPEIGLLGDLVATSSQDGADGDGNDRFSAREVELIVGGYVDPYSRFDATFAFSDSEAADIEEAYLTYWNLPWDLKGRFGRFFPKIGKTAGIHRDQLSTVDEPIVIRRYFGAEGYFRSGADLTGILEGPGGTVLEPTVGVLEGGIGEGAATFGSTRRRPTLYSHLKAFKDLTEASNLELGISHLVGSSDADAAFEVNVLGLDATYLNHLSPSTKLKLQGEFYLQHRDEAFGIDSTTGATTQFDRHPWGAYLLADYKFAPRWGAGLRADHARLIDTAASRHADQGLSAFVTFYQSEWARWRLQYRHEERASSKEDDAVFLQGTFAIGTHKHQLQ